MSSISAKINKVKPIAQIVKEGLPHAFDFRYWNLANTTYREEIAIVTIEKFNLNNKEAKTFLRMCGLFKKDFPIPYYMIDGHIKESNGAHYGVTVIGDKFLDKFILNKHKK